MRTEIYLQFRCSVCGSFLEAEGNEAVKGEKEGVTGASLLASAVIIKPCSQCIEKEVKPARDLVSAIKTLEGMV